jgi:hypothetical protein
MKDMHGHQQLEDSETALQQNADLLRQALINDIDRLNRFSYRGVLALALFLLVSIIAWCGYYVLAGPATVLGFLGKPPSARMISTALLIYTFSAIILSLSRMAAGIEHRSSFAHVGYLAVFYLFYYFGTSLEENFWAVLVSGITILGVESYRIWSYCAESIARKNEQLIYIHRTGRAPVEE